jgi:hypothetical protein
MSTYLHVDTSTDMWKLVRSIPVTPDLIRSPALRRTPAEEKAGSRVEPGMTEAGMARSKEMRHGRLNADRS